MLKHAGSTLFIVDDEPTNLGVLVEALEEAGFNLAVARSGEKALKQIAKLKPDLILLDVRMPGIDGFETCRRLKQEAATQDIPVIFMTALTETVEKITGFEIGGVDYITKPFQIAEVLARVQAHLTIRNLQQRLQEEIAVKNTFFSMIAHDLKNPLAGLLAFAEILEDFNDLTEDERQTLVKQFRESAETLFALLENLLTWARLQQGQLPYTPEEIPLNTIIHRNLELLRVNAVQKQVRFTNRIHANLPVYADVNMLDAVVRNLLSNAIKFTPTGGAVEISATLAAGQVHVSVADTGIGIAKEKLPLLFQVASDCQRDGTAGEKGTGLGLILCKEFIAKHGGRIWADSHVGQGATFTFSLPVHPKSGQEESTNEKP